ncbi:unnamed protein product [Cuscuta campestris]|uniref:Integrase catalytic domain-containing protein n=1 Tax=Cuscuta campestris TaxID=132261 RepID=A0A484NM49_9ASTE|nr:unnamed protein product [Cuscuta campestris]
MRGPRRGPPGRTAERAAGRTAKRTDTGHANGTGHADVDHEGDPRANSPSTTWPEFLDAVQQRFDPNYYENYVGLLSKLTQSSSVMEYQSAFESILNKVSGVPESTLVAMYIAGLKQPVQREVNLWNPSTLPATFALARELSACHQEAAVTYSSRARRPWPQRPPSTATAGLLPTPPAAPKLPSPAPRPSASPSNLPIVRLTNAEKAERNKKGLCWYCDEKWIRGHHCKHRFLVFMGPDDDVNPLDVMDLVDSDQELAVISGDVSSLHSLAGSPSPRSLKLAGSVKEMAVQVLLDGGSTHNFVHPAVAERLALTLHPVPPFRVYVGNGDSLRCAYSCPQTPLCLQGHRFDVDLYILEIHGPDIVLGVQWLQTLGTVSHDYSQLTMEFTWKGSPVLLRGDAPHPRPVSYSQFCRLAAAPDGWDMYELMLAETPLRQDSAGPIALPDDVPEPIRAVLLAHSGVFGLPQGLPPSRPWDHRIHLDTTAKPVNVRPYRYPYFQKTEIERQVREMLDQGLIRHSHSPYSSPVLLVQESFANLKRAMTTAPVLRLPDFTQIFVVETDASTSGIEAVLMQQGHPLAFFSKKLGPRRRASSTYHKELYVIVEAVQKWRQYLLGREFVIRTDQRSLKELLLQVVQTPDQQFYIRKLMGFKFRIEYKSEVSNRAADALSRRDEDSDMAGLFMAYAQPLPTLLRALLEENSTLPDLIQLHSSVRDGTASSAISIHNGLLYHGHRLYLSSSSKLRDQLLHEFHATPLTGHQGVERTFRRLAQVFYWPSMRWDVRQFVASCAVCQATKYSTQHPAGLLQPLPILDQVWESASMDFITGLPPSQGFTVIMVVVDRLSKYSHFGALAAGFDSPRVARLFTDVVVKHHGFPRSVISDKDSVFMSLFWKELMRLSGSSLKFSTAYHPQSDGQTEVLNRSLEQYLRAFTYERPTKWTSFLPWAELALNCSQHEGLGVSPFQALYGRAPPSLFPTLSVRARVPAVEELLRERADLLTDLKAHLTKMQHRMRSQANQHRRDVSFAVGDMVLLKLRPYRQHSMPCPLSAKLAQRYYGPFEVLERVGAVAYRLRLPDGCKIHDVFHVSLLRPFLTRPGSSPTPSLPDCFFKGRPVSLHVVGLDSRTVLVDGQPQEQWLIRWSDGTNNDATWEPVVELLDKYPDLRLVDKVVPNPGGVDTGHANGTGHADVDHEGDPRVRRPRRNVGRPRRFEDYV